MTIEDLMYYGRYYDFEDEGYHLWWFDPFNGNIHQFDELINDFGYTSQEDIISSKKFIPLFETNIINLEQEFLRQYNLEIRPFGNSNDMDFDTKFKMLIEQSSLLESWHDFEYQNLHQDAIVWCDKNHIWNKVNQGTENYSGKIEDSSINQGTAQSGDGSMIDKQTET